MYKPQRYHPRDLPNDHGLLLKKEIEIEMGEIVIPPLIEEARERIIERAIMAHPEKLGFPGAHSIRNWRVAPTSGRVDIGLLPVDGPVSLVLVEAKGAVAVDAACKVIGQLLMYYAGALGLGSEGLSLLNAFAKDEETARNTSKKSFITLTGGIRPNRKAWEALTKGTQLAHAQVRLFIALNDKPHHALEPVLATLREHHRLPIGLVVVKDGKITVQLPAD